MRSTTRYQPSTVINAKSRMLGMFCPHHVQSPWTCIHVRLQKTMEGLKAEMDTCYDEIAVKAAKAKKNKSQE